MKELNFDRVEKSFNLTLNMWKQRNLTIFGHKQILQTLAIPKILYVTNILESPPKFIETIQKLIAIYIWQNKRPKVRYKALIYEYSDSGICLMDVKCRIKMQQIMWIIQLINNKNNKWTLIPNEILRSICGVSNIRSNFDIRCLPHTMTHFYITALSAWLELTSVNPVTRDEVILQPLCNNRIQNNGKSLFFSKLYNEGLICIADICDNFGHILCLSKLVEFDIFKKYFLTHMSLKCSIPKSWNELLNNSIDIRRTIDRTQFDKTILIKTGVLTIDKSKSCDVYNILIQGEVQPPTSNLSIYTGLLDAQSREFQFRIIHNYLTLNQNMYKWNLCETCFCPYCNTYPEQLNNCPTFL